jgi:hypothetical protein
LFVATQTPIVLKAGEFQQLQAADALVDPAGTAYSEGSFATTSAGTLTLVVGSANHQFFTGTTTTVTLPVASTLTQGWTRKFHNDGTGLLTINSSGTNLVVLVPRGNSTQITCVAITGTDATSWSVTRPVANVGFRYKYVNSAYTGTPGNGNLIFVNYASAGVGVAFQDADGNDLTGIVISATANWLIVMRSESDPSVVVIWSVTSTAAHASYTTFTATLLVGDGTPISGDYFRVEFYYMGPPFTYDPSLGKNYVLPTPATSTPHLAQTDAAQTFTGLQTIDTLAVTPTARTSGVAPYLTVTTPADTGITASTESIGANFAAAGRTWVDGTTTLQRERVFAAPVYNKTTTAAVFTTAVNVDIADPVAGAGVTFTNKWAARLGSLLVTGIATITGIKFDNTWLGSSAWIDMPITGSSGIGSGGAGASPWVAYVSGNGHWFSDSQIGDICYRNTAGLLLFGNTSGTSSLAISGDKIVRVNKVASAGWGVPAIYAAGRSVAATGAVASVSTYTVGAADGSFEVSANVLVTTSTTHTFTVTCAYTDESNVARTLTMTFGKVAGSVTTTTIANIGGTGPYMGVPLHIRCKASTAITIATTGTFTTVTYNVEGIIKQTA